MGSRVTGASARVAAMKPELSEVRAAALLLPSDDREELLEELAASLDGVEPELTEEMVAELERRQASIRAGDYVDIETFLSSSRP
jgi:putative addiction module component (TIGR02574 family)